MGGGIDFDLIKTRSLDSLEAILTHWFPNGKKAGREFQLGSLAGEAGQSLKIHLNGGKRGVRTDFSTGEGGGDPISLIAAADRIGQGEAAKKLADFLGLDMGKGTQPERASRPEPSRPKADSWRPILPVPESAPPRPEAHPKHGGPNVWHTYRDSERRALGHMARFEAAPPKRTKKEFFWLVYAERDSRREWRWQGFPVPRPLYGLDSLAAHRGRPVLLVEGEKSADAASLLLPDWVCMTWPGGSKAVDKADFAPLKGRDVVLWPDADAPGRQAMNTAAKRAHAAGAASVRSVNLDLLTVLTPGRDADGAAILQEGAGMVRMLPEGWDAADAAGDGWTADHLAVLQARPDFLATAEARPAMAVDAETAKPGKGADSRFSVTDDGLFSSRRPRRARHAGSGFPTPFGLWPWLATRTEPHGRSCWNSTTWTATDGKKFSPSGYSWVMGQTDPNSLPIWGCSSNPTGNPWTG